jgi:polyvinyl alcohol dehydrogenase (cytochrome)
MRVSFFAVAVGICSLALGSSAHAQRVDGSAVFTKNCAMCHDGAATSRAPAPEQLKSRSPESIVDALTGGAMRYQGLSLSGAERKAVAEFLSGKTMGGEKPLDLSIGRCAAPRPMANPASAPMWNGWGPTLANTHNQPAKAAGVSAEALPKLTLKWALGLPEATSAWAQPTVVGGRLFVGTQNGTVYSLDAKSGCVAWTYVAKSGVRGSVSIGALAKAPSGHAAYFSDQKGYAYALDADSGKEIWSVVVDPHPLIRLTGSPALYQNRLYVPTSSYEEVGKSPTYNCCTFRGAVVALDTATGNVVWRSFVVGEPVLMGKRPDGGESWGPSGGAIWSAPTIDIKRRAIYIGTGNTYSGKTQPMTEAVVALDLATGTVKWARQVTPDDVYGCRNGEANCGTAQGPDFDFGVSPMLTTRRDGKDVLIIGQKSGVAFVLDPDEGGKLLWQYRAGRGGALGGIEWGVTADENNAYFPVADNPNPGGLHAVDLITGQRVWFAPPVTDLKCGRGRGCNASQSAAITVIPGAVLSGSFDGGIRAYSTKDGSILWEYDTNKEFLTVNGVKAHGASLNGPAPVVVGGMVYVNSGDYRARTGNVLLAFGID